MFPYGPGGPRREEAPPPHGRNEVYRQTRRLHLGHPSRTELRSQDEKEHQRGTKEKSLTGVQKTPWAPWTRWTPWTPWVHQTSQPNRSSESSHDHEQNNRHYKELTSSSEGLRETPEVFPPDQSEKSVHLKKQQQQ